MAAPMNLHSNFCHELFTLLKKSPTAKQLHSESLFAIFNDIVLAWDNFKCVFRVCNVSTATTLITPRNDDDDSLQIPPSSSPQKIQALVCSNPPLFSVTSIIVNSSENHVALVGAKGVAIMELPSRYGANHLFQGGKEQILCKTMLVDDRYFSSHRKEAVLKVLWHPGSPNSSHICVLTSDDTIRVYNISKLDCPYQIFPLDSSSKSRFSSALGESFISMTFGLPLATAAENHSIWPLYLLTEMGCVYVLHTKLWSNRLTAVEGPLKMFPTAEDNYGTDFCDILHLASSPQCLIISTTSGSLIHSVILPSEDYEQEPDESYNIADGLDVLYVYDIVKLELRLSLPNGRGSYDRVDEEFTTPLFLVKDPVWTDSYYCMHSTGVHAVRLPWLHHFQQFSLQGDTNRDASFSMSEDQLATVCQHVICTQPLADSKPSPLRGLAILPDDIHCTTLFCLLSDFTCVKLSVRHGAVSKLPSMLSSLRSPSKENNTARKSFDTHIAEFIQKDCSNPIIRTGSEQSLSLEQSYHLLERSTQIFREQNVNKLLTAREELDRRVSSLDTLKGQQAADLAVLKEQKLQLIDKARDLAEHYEDICEQNELISARMDTVVSKIQSSISDLSDEERSISAHLGDREREVKELQAQLEQIKKKYKHQRESLSKKSSGLPCLNESQLRRVNGILSDESQQIQELVHQLRDVMTVTE